MPKRINYLFLLTGLLLASCQGQSTSGAAGQLPQVVAPADSMAFAPTAHAPTASIYVALFDSTPGAKERLLSFDRESSGNAPPLSRLPFALVESVTSTGDFWSAGPSRKPVTGLYDAKGSLIRALREPQGIFGVLSIERSGTFYGVIGGDGVAGSGCTFSGPVTLNKYRQGAHGPELMQSLDLGSRICLITAVAAGADGSLFVANKAAPAPSQGEIISHYAPDASGATRPIGKIVAPTAGFDTVSGLAADTAGNLYAVYAGALFEYVHSKQPAKKLFAAAAIALDAKDNLYVVRQGAAKSGSAAGFEVDEFAPGVSTPFRTISGPKTGLNVSAPSISPSIAVAP